MQRKAKEQHRRLSENVRQAKENRADLKDSASSSNRRHNNSSKKPPVKKGGFFSSLFSRISSFLARKLFGRADPPRTAQQSIPYMEMYKDGVCRVDERLFTKTIQFFDINYQLAQTEDKTHIFENYCDWLNYFDASISVQISCINQYGNLEDFQRSIIIPEREDNFNPLRGEYSGMLQNQQAKGNNGLVKTKYVTFGIEADNLKAAKQRLERVEADILANFKVLGVSAQPYTGRFLNENPVEFHPEMKVFINTNHLPKTSDDTVFISGRVKLIPFERHFTPKEQDMGLKKLFRKRDNMSGILNWLIEGYRLLKAEGLGVPDKVRRAIEEYRLDADNIGMFLKEVLVPASGNRLKTSDLHRLHQVWAKDNGYRTMSNQEFVGEFRRRNLLGRDRVKGNVVIGFDVKKSAG